MGAADSCKSKTELFDAECRAKRRVCRMLKRRYRPTRSSTACRAWVDSTRNRLWFHRSKKEEYWLISRLETCGRSSTKIWKTMSPLLRRNRDVAVFFARLIERVRLDTTDLPATNHRQRKVVVHVLPIVFTGRV